MRLPTEFGYTIDEAASSELEVREFLTALVRIQKPRLVVETGCYRGRGTLAIAQGLQANDRGRLITCDTVLYHCAHVMSITPRLFVDVRYCAGVDLAELGAADLVFLDSDYRHRRAEFDLVKPGALVVIHDTRISYDSAVPPHERWVKELGGFLFDTHRGFGLIRKAAPPA